MDDYTLLKYKYRKYISLLKHEPMNVTYNHKMRKYYKLLGQRGGRSSSTNNANKNGRGETSTMFDNNQTKDINTKTTDIVNKINELISQVKGNMGINIPPSFTHRSQIMKGGVIDNKKVKKVEDSLKKNSIEDAQLEKEENEINNSIIDYMNFKNELDKINNSISQIYEEVKNPKNKMDNKILKKLNAIINNITAYKEKKYYNIKKEEISAESRLNDIKSRRIKISECILKKHKTIFNYIYDNATTGKYDIENIKQYIRNSGIFIKALQQLAKKSSPNRAIEEHYNNLIKAINEFNNIYIRQEYTKYEECKNGKPEGQNKKEEHICAKNMKNNLHESLSKIRPLVSVP